MSTSIRIATYNIHKCRGLDRRVSPERIAAVIRELSCDIVALQEVLREKARDQFQLLSHLADLPYHCFGETRKHLGHDYGNAILSRFAIEKHRSYDITIANRESRGLLRADIRLPSGDLLHVLNVHMGTGLRERRRQAERLLHEEVLLSKDFSAPKILLGDFNEWTLGLATKSLSEHFHSAEGVSAKQSAPIRSYPGILPLLHLDHIYYDDALQLRTFRLHRTRTALVASDHLPLLACFELAH